LKAEKKYQVVIIGGGLAGLTLAIQLLKAGISCVVFEKNKFPFHKVCGEYVSNESKDFLKRLGFDVAAMDLPQIRHLQVSSPSGNLLKHDLDLGGFGISRFMMDQKLADIVNENGGAIRDDCKVNDVTFDGKEFQVSTSEGIYFSRLCIGAWGKKSNMDVKLGRVFGEAKGRRNYVGIKYHVYIDLPDDLIGLHNFRNGYCGISKIEANRFCLCYLTDSSNLKKYKGDIKKMEEEVLMQNPYLKKYFKEAKFLFEEPLAISNIIIGNKGAVADHVLMLGDSAGGIAPLSGNGMSIAMRSSFHLSGLLEKYFANTISREQLEKAYQKFWRKEFSGRITFSGLLQKMLKNTKLTDAAIAVLKRNFFLRDKIVRSTHGDPF
jgi:menaquinone-9 beta-reductase